MIQQQLKILPKVDLFFDNNSSPALSLSLSLGSEEKTQMLCKIGILFDTSMTVLKLLTRVPCILTHSKHTIFQSASLVDMFISSSSIV